MINKALNHIEELLVTFLMGAATLIIFVSVAHRYMAGVEIPVLQDWLLTLNFGYHNAHHVHPTTPWYALPRLHRELYSESAAQVLPVSALLMAYALHRVARVLNADPADAPIPPAQRFIGVVDVSFLTAH